MGAGSGDIGNLKSIQSGTTSTTRSIQRTPSQPKRTRRTDPRLTLSATIASQTFSSVPDGSDISSDAKGTPAATAGCGRRFRASSTVSSSSSPCSVTVGHSRRRNGRARAADGGGPILAAHCPVAEYPLEYAVRAREWLLIASFSNPRDIPPH